MAQGCLCVAIPATVNTPLQLPHPIAFQLTSAERRIYLPSHHTPLEHAINQMGWSVMRSLLGVIQMLINVHVATHCSCQHSRFREREQQEVDSSRHHVYINAG